MNSKRDNSKSNLFYKASVTKSINLTFIESVTSKVTKD